MNSADAPRRVRSLPSWQLNQAASRGTRLVAERAADLGVTRSTFSILAALDEFGPSSQAELGRRVGLDRKDVSSLVAGLEADGLVRRGPDERDGRRKLLEITPHGLAMLERLDGAFTAAQDELLAVLSIRDRVELARLLLLIADSDTASAPSNPRRDLGRALLG
ncbi:MarR family winged helix-turn-helix transcriptional regulator [Lysinimonas soli]|uniref:MarR family winged helix-turn-helix transcriptional regulator n=1 Tax=Lysinimonas soli TaxID=1074233 RepID=A0ABW0NU64_9MICO